jgi:predicted aspartyl protease
MLRFRFGQTCKPHGSNFAPRAGKVFAFCGAIAFGKIHAAQTLFLFSVSLVALTNDVWAKHSDAVRKIPFKLYQNHLVIAVGSLGGSEQRNLMIDTGTNPTIVDDTTARELGLERVSRSGGSTSVVNGSVPTYHSILPTLDLGPIHREAMPVAVTDLSRLREQIGIQVDAVIGLDVLAQLNFQIDYQSRRISFGAIRIARSAVPMEQADRLLIVQATLNGEPAKLMVDTGGSSLILFAQRLPQSTSWRTLGATVKLSNMGGDAELQKVQLKELRIGKTNLSDSLALVGKTPTLSNFQGILGISARKFKRIGFDFRRRLVGFELQDTHVMDVMESFDAPACETLFGSPICRTAASGLRVVGVR